MTNATYESLVNDAIAEAERFLSLGVRTEDIVMVMTRNVYTEAVGQKCFWRTDIRPETLAFRTMFYDYNVGLINEDTYTMFKAMVKGMNYYTGMTVGDTIIVDEDTGACRIYTLESTMPVCFTDTGLTVRFEIEPLVTSADQFDRWASAMAVASFSDMDFDSFLKAIQCAPRTKSYLRPKPELRPPKEADLSGGDTKELDDFLSSFAKKVSLESAT